MKQYQWNYDDSGNIIYDYSSQELSRRKHYLKQVDQYSKLKLEDFEKSVIPGRTIMAYGAGYGKTSALRQFICKPSTYREGVVVATHRIEYVDQLAYDIAAMLDDTEQELVVALHSQSEASSKLVEDITYLKKYKVVITTHKRLLMDNILILMDMDNTFYQLGERVGRKYMFIDEDPQYMTKMNVIPEILSMLSADVVREASNKGIHIKDVDYRDIVKRIYDDLSLSRELFSVFKKPYSSIAGSMSYDDLVNKNLKCNRFLHKLSIILSTLILRLSTASQDVTAPVYYHLGILKPEYLTILDGTGDITNKTSELWNTSVKPKRHLSLSNIEILPNTSLPRRPDEALNYEEFVSSIVEVANKNEKVLVVTWKDLKGDDDSYIKELQYVTDTDSEDAVSEVVTKSLRLTDSFSEYLRQKLPEGVREKVEFITYLSGEERVTSKYSDCTAIMFLGKFFLPNSEIDKLNKLKLAKESSKDYTSSLLIQAIYRTVARHDKPVELYFSSDWSTNYVLEVMRYFEDLVDTNRSLYRLKFDYLLDSVSRTKRNEVYYDMVMSKREELLNNRIAEYEVPKGMITRDCKRSVSNLVSKYDWIEYINVNNSNRFLLKLK